MTENELLQAIYKDMQGLKKDVSELKEDVSELKEDVSELKEDVSKLKEDVSELKSDVSELKSDVSELKDDVRELKRRTSSLELTLENETNTSIKIIAEGHLDINRKLDDALRVENEKEILLLRVTHLENELRKIKEQLTA